MMPELVVEVLLQPVVTNVTVVHEHKTAPRDHPDLLENPVLPVMMDSQDKPVSQDWLDRLKLKNKKAVASNAKLDHPVHLDPMDQPDHPDLMANPVIPVLQAKMVSPDLLDLKVMLAPLDQLALPVNLGQRVMTELMEKDNLDPKDPQADPVLLEHPDKMENPEKMVRPDPQDLKDHPVVLVSLAKMVKPAKMANQVNPVLMLPTAHVLHELAKLVWLLILKLPEAMKVPLPLLLPLRPQLLPPLRLLLHQVDIVVVGKNASN